MTGGTKKKAPAGSAPSIPIEQYLEEQKKSVDAYLDDFLPSAQDYPEVIHEAMRYSLFAGGKRLRPILALATGEALEGPFERIICLACALEMVHCYSLIHDDLPALDNDDLRRGKPTSHKVFGEAIAVLAGDALLTQAFQLLSEIPDGAGTAEAKVKVINRLSRAIGTSRGMIGGQVVDLQTEGKPFTRQQLEYIHCSKTGALIQASIDCAAILSGADREARNRLAAFAGNVGLAFQIVDDILDIEGTTQELGKTSGKDDASQKATYPALYGIERSRQIVQELVEAAGQELSWLGSRGRTLRELADFVSIRRF